MTRIRIDIPLGVASPSFKSYWVTYDEACRLKEQLEESIAPIRQAKYEAEVSAEGYRQHRESIDVEGFTMLLQRIIDLENATYCLDHLKACNKGHTEVLEITRQHLIKLGKQLDSQNDHIHSGNIHNQKEIDMLNERIASLESSVFQLYQGKP